MPRIGRKAVERIAEEAVQKDSLIGVRRVERLVLATSRYIGEGFDDARLDTLFLALPVSWRGTLVRYAGRLHRLYPGKTEVRIYDYVDREVPMLLRMFEKSLRGYRAIGYARGEAPLAFGEADEVTSNANLRLTMSRTRLTIPDGGLEGPGGKVVVITGASSRIGEATARHLASKGAKVFLGARRADRLKAPWPWALEPDHFPEPRPLNARHRFSPHRSIIRCAFSE